MDRSRTDDEKLFRHLKRNYREPSYIPPFGENFPVSISTDYLPEIVDVDDKTGHVTLAGMLRMSWYDMHLTWDPTDFGDIPTVYMPASEVWTPDIMMRACLSSELSATMVSVNHEGNVVYEPHIVTRLKPRLRFRSNYEVELVIWSVYSPNLVEFCWQFEGTCLDRFLDNPFWDLEPQGQQSERAGSGSQYALRINVVKKN